jgi:hypothetical protein
MMKKGFAIVFVSLMLLSSFAFLVSAQQSIVDKVFGATGGVEFNFPTEDFQKILMFFLVVLILYSVFSYIPFLGDKKFITFLVSVVVGILSVWFLNTEEVRTAVFSYSALGTALTLVLPFFAILIISKKFHDSGYELMSKFLWIAFLVVLVVRWITSENLTLFFHLVFSGILVCVLIMFFFDRAIHRFMKKREVAKSFNEAAFVASRSRLGQMSTDFNNWQNMPGGSEKDARKKDLLKMYGTAAKDYFG